MEPLFGDHPGWKRLYVDLPGMGSSPARPPGANADAVVEVLVALIVPVMEARPEDRALPPARK